MDDEEPIPVDLPFNNRIIGIDSDGDSVDMGAIETNYVACYGDLDNDDDVDSDDILIIVTNWGACTGDPCVGDFAPGGPCYAIGDSAVGPADVLTVIANFGPCSHGLSSTMSGPALEECLECLAQAEELGLSDEDWIDFMIECLSYCQ